MDSTTPQSIGIVAIAGATGRVAAELTRSLAAHGVAVRALTRDPSKAAPIIGGATPVAIDFADPDTLRRAVDGARKLVISLGGSPQQADQEIALIDAAVAAGVEHLVKVSTLSWPSLLHPLDWHARVEEHLAGLSIGFSLLRPSSFSSLLASSARAIKAGSWGGAAGRGRVNLVDTRDVAEVAAHLLYTASGPDQQRPYHLTGDRAWTMTEIAELFSVRLGQPVNYEHRTPAEQRRVLSGAGVPQLFIDVLVGLDHIFASSAQSETTMTVAEVLGRPPRSVADWITDNIHLFR